MMEQARRSEILPGLLIIYLIIISKIIRMIITIIRFQTKTFILASKDYKYTYNNCSKFESLRLKETILAYKAWQPALSAANGYIHIETKDNIYMNINIQNILSGTSTEKCDLQYTKHI